MATGRSITSTCAARAALAGNPSDGYGGAVVAVLAAALISERYLAELDRLLERARQPPDPASSTYDEALALWRGRPFGELADGWWAVPDAARLTEQRHAAGEDRAAGTRGAMPCSSSLRRRSAKP